MDLKQKLDEMSELTLKFEQMNSSEFTRAIKAKNVSLFLNEKYNNPSMSKKDICKKIGISLPVLNQDLRDLNYTDFIRKRVNKKKTAKKPIKKELKGGIGLRLTEEELEEKIKNGIKSK